MAVKLLALLHARLKSLALLERIGQFAESIGQFDAATIQFETLGQARIGRLAAGEGGLLERIIVENGRSAIAKVGFDPLAEHPAEYI